MHTEVEKLKNEIRLRDLYSSIHKSEKTCSVCKIICVFSIILLVVCASTFWHSICVCNYLDNPAAIETPMGYLSFTGDSYFEIGENGEGVIKVDTQYLNEIKSDYSTRAALCAIASVALAIVTVVSFVKAFNAKDEANYAQRQIDLIP